MKGHDPLGELIDNLIEKYTDHSQIGQITLAREDKHLFTVFYGQSFSYSTMQQS